MDRIPLWCVSDVAVGDYIEVQIINKKGDRNLDGAVIRGVIKELHPDYKAVEVESGWWCHTKDKLLKRVARGLHVGGKEPQDHEEKERL